MEYQKMIDHSVGVWPAAVGLLGSVYGRSGQRDKALERLDKLKERATQERVPAIFFAWIYNGLGDRDEAFKWLEKAYEERTGYLIHLKASPAFDPLHSDPRYKELLKKIGLPTE